MCQEDRDCEKNKDGCHKPSREVGPSLDSNEAIDEEGEEDEEDGGVEDHYKHSQPCSPATPALPVRASTVKEGMAEELFE